MGATAELVVTEHPSFLDAKRAERYEEIRAVLEGIAGRPVSSTHYLDVDGLGPGPVVLSGSGAPWSAHDPARLEGLGDVVRRADAPVLGIIRLPARNPCRAWPSSERVQRDQDGHRQTGWIRTARSERKSSPGSSWFRASAR